MKQCSRCKETKSESEFYKCSRLKDGLQSYCKTCCREYQQTPRVKAKARCYNQSARGKVVHNQYATSEKGRQVQRRFRQSDKGKEAAYRGNNSSAGREAHYRDYARRVAILESSEATLTAAEWLELVGQHTCCPLCHREFGPVLKVTMDHVVPLTKGGVHTIENVQPLCRPCNSSKGNTL